MTGPGALRGLAVLLLVAPLAAWSQPAATDRGRMLYTTHCIECHTSRMHWRDAALARDWDSLKVQVRRWQREARLGWGDEEVDAVARYLNESIYRFPQPVASGPAARGR